VIQKGVRVDEPPLTNRSGIPRSLTSQWANPSDVNAGKQGKKKFRYPVGANLFI